jgi:hypothetical protein
MLVVVADKGYDSEDNHVLEPIPKTADKHIA